MWTQMKPSSCPLHTPNVNYTQHGSSRMVSLITQPRNNGCTKHLVHVSSLKPRNTLEHEPKPSCTELAQCVSVDGIPSRGEKARLAAWPNPQAVSPSKWASTMPLLTCAQCGRVNSVWWNWHSFNSQQLTRCAHTDEGELGFRMWDSHSCLQYYFCIDEPSRANSTWARAQVYSRLKASLSYGQVTPLT